MDKEKHCPHYVDYLRECIFDLKSLSWEKDTIVKFCTSDGYKDCPFFQAIENPHKTCDQFKVGVLCEHYDLHDFDGFLALCKKWCLGDFKSCARHKTRKLGETPEADLHPDGHIMDAQ